MRGFLETIESLHAGIFWAVAFLVVGFTAVIAWALYHHWKEYTLDSKKSSKMFRGYLVVVGILIFIMALNLIMYLY